MHAEDVDAFAHWHVRSGDIDPVYPVLECVMTELGLSPSERAELVLLYVAYYSLPSALRTWLEGWRLGEPLTDEQLRYTTGTERRAHRDVRQFRRHLQSLAAVVFAYADAARFLDVSPTNPVRRWDALQRRLDAVHGNGRWAGYKTGEICDTVLHLNCPPPDAGHAHSSGPRKGLADIFPESAVMAGNDPLTIQMLDAWTEQLVERWAIPVAQVETVLCDWHSMVKGSYYVGHDIDLLLHHAERTEHPKARKLIMRARLASFEERWLGELNGWHGVRPNLKTAYRDERIIEWW